MKKIGKISITLVIVFGIFIGFYFLESNNKNNYTQIAIMLEQDDGSYLRSTTNSFTEEGYEFDHGTCLNGSIVSLNEAGGIKVSFNGADKCNIYLAKIGNKSNILVPGNLLSSIKSSVGATIDDEIDGKEYIGKIIKEYGIRYEGKNPNNYVQFNNELWRIVGIFNEDTTGYSEPLVKLVRHGSIGDNIWSTDSKNNWNTASLQTYLNGTYYNGLTTTAKGQIQEIKWKIGAISRNDYSNFSLLDWYTTERGNTPAAASGSTTITTNYLKVGLIYPSDYGYGVSGEDCNRNIKLSNYSECYVNDWLHYSLEPEISEDYGAWLLTPDVVFDFSIFYVDGNGGIGYGSTEEPMSVSPSVYLKSTTILIGGEGTIEEPYTIQ